MPVSIVVVGIGPAEFNSMSVLDSNKLIYGGRAVDREVVQFVAFREFVEKYDATSGSYHLTKHVMANIPDQMIGYMKLKGILPKKRRILSHLQ